MPIQMMRREPTAIDILSAADDAFNAINSDPRYDGGHVVIIFLTTDRQTQGVLVCEPLDDKDEVALCLDQIRELIRDGARYNGMRATPHAEGYNIPRPDATVDDVAVLDSLVSPEPLEVDGLPY